MKYNQKKLNEVIQRPGSSIWFSSLPLIDEGYALNKQDFTDMIKIKYGRHLHRLPGNCVCGQKLKVGHTLPCKKRRFITIRDNQERDTTANLLK